MYSANNKSKTKDSGISEHAPFRMKSTALGE